MLIESEALGSGLDGAAGGDDGPVSGGSGITPNTVDHNDQSGAALLGEWRAVICPWIRFVAIAPHT